MSIKILLACLSLFLLLINSNSLGGSGRIQKTKHNLSVTGEGSIKSPSETVENPLLILFPAVQAID